MSKPVLYSYFRSSCSWRVRIALDFKGIKYEYRAVDVLKTVDKRGNFQEINPIGTVPALEIDGIVITNSSAIIEYLDETREGISLLPNDPIERTKVRAISDAIVSGIQPLQNVTVLKHINNIQSTIPSKDWGAFYIVKGFKAVEKLLNSSSGKYCVGDSVTLADLCLVPQVFNAAKFDVDLNQFPKIKSINDELLKLDAFRQTHPFRQPDCPADLKTN